MVKSDYDFSISNISQTIILLTRESFVALVNIFATETTKLTECVTFLQYHWTIKSVWFYDYYLIDSKYFHQLTVFH